MTCQEMSGDVRKCQEMSGDVRKGQERKKRRKAWEPRPSWYLPYLKRGTKFTRTLHKMYFMHHVTAPVLDNNNMSSNILHYI